MFQYQGAVISAPVVRREEARLALPLQRERDVRRIEDRVIEEDEARAAGDARVAALVEIHLLRADEPVVVAGAAGRVARALEAVVVGALEEQPLGGAAPLQRLGGGPRGNRAGDREHRSRIGRLRRRQDRAQPDRRLFEESPLGAEVEPQAIAFEQIAAVLGAHVAFRFEQRELRFVAHRVGRERLAEPPKNHSAFGLDGFFAFAAQRVRFNEQRRGLLAQRRQRE
jgi:hypothetical protein